MIDIALDARLTSQMSVGMKAYSRELTTRLPLLAPQWRFSLLTQGENFSFAEQIGLPLELLRSKPRLTHFLSVYAPLLAPAPFVITIHDLIHLRYPGFFKKRVGPYYRLVVRGLCARAARVITDDERTIDDLELFLGVAREKIRVIPLGVDDQYLEDAQPMPVEQPFFLYVGNHREHKDLPTLLAAWSSLPQHLAVDLYLTGDDDLPPEWHTQRTWGKMRFLGEVTKEKLARLYCSCVALVHPALREGFGLTMVEAAALGARVLACEDAVPTVLQPYVEHFPARDIHALRSLMEGVLTSEYRHPRLGEVARGLTWERCARATAEVYEEVLEECGSR